MIESIFLIALVFLAVFTINTKNLRRAVVYLGIFSLLSSFVSLLYGAPDVAIAEAIIGSTITTVLYLVALKKYQNFLIYYTEDKNQDQKKPATFKTPFLESLELFLQSRNMKPQFIYSDDSIETILKAGKFDLAVYQDSQNILVYGCAEDYQMDAVEEYLKNTKQNLSFVRCQESVESEA